VMCCNVGRYVAAPRSRRLGSCRYGAFDHIRD
jgi:hypothetical protein